MANKKKGGDDAQKSKKEEQVEETKEKEGQNLLGSPTFKKLENGRFKCAETGHELPVHTRESYAQSKHCRLGLIDSALARNKPPLNMFQQDPSSRSKLICKLTGLTVNKSEEHIWKHINGKRFLNMLEKKEDEKQTPNGLMGEQNEQKPDEVLNSKAESLKKRKNKKKNKSGEHQEEENVNKVISEARNSSDKDSDSEEDDFWMPPVGDRWDFDNGGDRWGSDSESGPEIDDASGAGMFPSSGPEVDDVSAADGAGEESNNIADCAVELTKSTKRMSIEIGSTDSASRKKKKKISPQDKNVVITGLESPKLKD